MEKVTAEAQIHQLTEEELSVSLAENHRELFQGYAEFFVKKAKEIGYHSVVISVFHVSDDPNVSGIGGTLVRATSQHLSSVAVDLLEKMDRIEQLFTLCKIIKKKIEIPLEVLTRIYKETEDVLGERR